MKAIAVLGLSLACLVPVGCVTVGYSELSALDRKALMEVPSVLAVFQGEGEGDVDSVGPLSAILPPMSDLPMDHQRYTDNKTGHLLRLR